MQYILLTGNADSQVPDAFGGTFTTIDEAECAAEHYVAGRSKFYRGIIFALSDDIRTPKSYRELLAIDPDIEPVHCIYGSTERQQWKVIRSIGRPGPSSRVEFRGTYDTCEEAIADAIVYAQRVNACMTHYAVLDSDHKPVKVYKAYS